MRHFCISLLALMAFAIAPLTAQIPFTVIAPTSSVLRMQASVGATVTSTVTVVRLSPTIDSMRVTSMTAPFSVNSQWRQFGVLDTMSFEVTFSPTAEGEFYDSLLVTDGWYSIGLTVAGTATSGVPWTISPGVANFGTVLETETRSITLTLSNYTAEEITVSWNKPGTIFETSISAGGMLVAGTEATVPAQSAVNIIVSANGALGDPGQYLDTLNFSTDPISSYTVSVALSAEIDVNDTTPSATDVVFVPDVLVFPSVAAAGSTTTSMQALVANVGANNVVLTEMNIAGLDASAFTFSGLSLPVVLSPGDSTFVTVTYDHTPQSMASAVLTLTWNHEGFIGLPVYSSQLTLTSDSLRPIVMRIGMTTNDANVGETTTATFTNLTDVPTAMASCIISLRYNATILVPETMPLDAEDPIVDGFRTSRFRLTVGSHAAGSTLGSVAFRVALGNSSSTPLEVTTFTWFDDQDEQITTSTSVNGAVVSVLDADGNEINVDAGPLTLSVSPTPITSQATISYQRGTEPARLKLYDQMGALVVDLSDRITGESGAFTLDPTALPTGVYVLHFTGGRHSYALRILVD